MRMQNQPSPRMGATIQQHERDGFEDAAGDGAGFWRVGEGDGEDGRDADEHGGGSAELVAFELAVQDRDEGDVRGVRAR